jgi:hypothetical protein
MVQSCFALTAFKMSNDGEEETACESASIEFILTGGLLIPLVVFTPQYKMQ